MASRDAGSGPMDEDRARALERQILVSEQGNLGARSGEIGGALGGAIGGGVPGQRGGGRGGRRGGRRGAEWAARRLGEDRAELSVDCDAPAETAMERAAMVLARAGRRVTDGVPALQPPEVWAVVPWGPGGLGRAVVRVAVVGLEAHRCRVVIRGVALEGLIKRHGGRQAATLVRDKLVQALGVRG